jgi:periplasmic protein TonB
MISSVLGKLWSKRKEVSMAMFEQTFVATAKTHKMGTVLGSCAVQTILVVIGILIPMIYFDALPTAQLRSLLLAPPPLPPTPPPPPREAANVVKFIPRQFDAGKLTAPQGVPQNITMIKEDDWPAPSAVSSVSAVSTDALVRILGPVPVAAPPPPPSVKKSVQTPRVRIGGIVQSAKLIRQPKPVYPELAKRARIQGVVRLHALISRDGTIEGLKVVSGHPLLVPSALEAVKQWVYQPTLLDGEPVEVETDIDVNFTLSQ